MTVFAFYVGVGFLLFAAMAALADILEFFFWRWL